MRHLILAFTFAFCGCYGVPSAIQLDKANYGTFPGDYESKIKSSMATVLFDPYSAVYQCSPPCEAFTVTPLWIGENSFGHLVRCSINAKNRFGGYVGARIYEFFFNQNGNLESTARGKKCALEVLATTQ